MPSPAQHQSRHMTIACARCGRAAAEIALLPESVKNPSLWVGRDRLERTEFMGTYVTFGRWEQLEDLFEAIRTGDYTLASQIDGESVSFVCKQCDCAYCEECWVHLPPEAVCPLGHKQITEE